MEYYELHVFQPKIPTQKLYGIQVYGYDFMDDIYDGAPL